MRYLGRKGARFAFALVLVAVLLAGAAVAGFAAGAKTNTTRIRVTEREYKLVLSSRSANPGKVTFVVRNAGKLGHEFAVRGPGIAGKRIAGVIAPGAVRTLTVRLRAGTFTLWCPIHAGLGMKTTIKVGNVASGGTTTGGGSTTTSWG
jgi:plastocyanin